MTMLASAPSITPIAFVRSELRSSAQNQSHLTVADLTSRTPKGISRDSVRLAVLNLLRSGEVDLNDDQTLSLMVAESSR